MGGRDASRNAKFFGKKGTVAKPSKKTQWGPFHLGSAGGGIIHSKLFWFSKERKRKGSKGQVSKRTNGAIGTRPE